MPIPITLLMVGVGLLLCALSLPLWLGKVKPNAYYGFRTPRVKLDPRVWYPVNRVAGRDLFLAGLAMAVLSAIPGLLMSLGPVGMILVPMAPLMLALLHGLWFASAHVADLDRGEPSAQQRAIADAPPEASAEAKKRRREGIHQR
jgi:hypothetical protein